MIKDACEVTGLKGGPDIRRDLRHRVEVELGQAEGRMEGSTVLTPKVHGGPSETWDLLKRKLWSRSCA